MVDFGHPRGVGPRRGVCRALAPDLSRGSARRWRRRRRRCRGRRRRWRGRGDARQAGGPGLRRRREGDQRRPVCGGDPPAPEGHRAGRHQRRCLQLARLRHAPERRPCGVHPRLPEGLGPRPQAPRRPRVHRRGVSRARQPAEGQGAPRRASTSSASSRARSTRISRRPSRPTSRAGGGSSRPRPTDGGSCPAQTNPPARSAVGTLAGSPIPDSRAVGPRGRIRGVADGRLPSAASRSARAAPTERR